jgi:glycosyltransferase involved in cell wall biosynthesis
MGAAALAGQGLPAQGYHQSSKRVADKTGMKIAYVLTSLGIGGAERQALALADRMADRGHAVALIILSLRLAPELEWPTNLEVISLGMDRTPASILAGITKARGFLRQFRPDLLHGHSFHANMTARLLRILQPKVPVVSTFHNVYEGGRRRMLAYRLTDRLCCLTTAVSEAVGRRYIQLKATSAHKCMVVRNGIDAVEFAPSAERRTAMRHAIGVDQEFVWLASGRIAPSKDYPNLLRAFARVRADRKDAVLWIAGSEASASLAAAVRALADDLRLGAAVRWLGLRNDLPGLLDAADGFVSASAWEGMPLAVGEAMAMQKAVVATDAGGTREMVGDAGTIVPLQDARALSEAMLRSMRGSQQDRDAVGRAARERIIKDFSMDARADEWEMIYRNVVRKSG